MQDSTIPQFATSLDLAFANVGDNPVLSTISRDDTPTSVNRHHRGQDQHHELLGPSFGTSSLDFNEYVHDNADSQLGYADSGRMNDGVESTGRREEDDNLPDIFDDLSMPSSWIPITSRLGWSPKEPTTAKREESADDLSFPEVGRSMIDRLGWLPNNHAPLLHPTTADLKDAFIGDEYALSESLRDSAGRLT